MSVPCYLSVVGQNVLKPLVNGDRSVREVGAKESLGLIQKHLIDL